MKRCPNCNRTYEDGFTFCLADGGLLSAPYDSEETVQIRKPSSAETLPLIPAARGKPRSNKLLWFVSGVAVLATATSLMLFIRSSKPGTSDNSSVPAATPASQKTNFSAEEALKNGIAATVNDRRIMLSEVDHLIDQQLEDKPKKISTDERKEARLQILDSLIEQEVMFQKAEKEGVAPTDDAVTTELNKNKQASGLSAEAFDEKLRKAGETEQSLRESIKKSLAVQNLDDKIAGKIELPQESEIQAYYDENKDSFAKKQGGKLSLESPGVRQGIVDAIIEQRKTALSKKYFETAKREAKIENYLADSKTY